MDAVDYSRLNEQLRLESMDYWRLCDELTIVQAALLVAGEDPATSGAFVENWEYDKRPSGYEAVKTAITYRIRKKLYAKTFQCYATAKLLIFNLPVLPPNVIAGHIDVFPTQW